MEARDRILVCNCPNILGARKLGLSPDLSIWPPHLSEDPARVDGQHQHSTVHQVHREALWQAVKAGWTRVRMDLHGHVEGRFGAAVGVQT